MGTHASVSLSIILTLNRRRSAIASAAKVNLFAEANGAVFIRATVALCKIPQALSRAVSG